MSIEDIIAEMDKDLKEINLNLDKYSRDQEYASYWFNFGKFWVIQKYLLQLKSLPKETPPPPEPILKSISKDA